MKTGTIVAIIVAAVVVVGVCVGIPLSGVLNGTSGTPGDTPVQPTEPPVETPPTPTETPSSTPMSSFSGGGMKSDSGSSSSDPITPPDESEPQRVLDEQNVPDGGIVYVSSNVIEGWVVSEMTMEFPLTYAGKVTFSEIPDTVTPPSNSLLAVDIDLSGELQGEGVDIILTVPIASLPSGFDVDDASLYHYGASGWTTLPTTYEVSTDGSEVTYKATATDFSPFALAFKENGATLVEPTPVPHEHQWVTKPIGGDKHQEICAECGEVKSDSSADCTIVYTSFEGLNPPTHNKTCVTCGRDDGGLICGDDGITLVSMAEKPAYHNETCTQCAYVLKSEVSCTINYKQNDDSTHTVFCEDGCGYEVLDVPCSGKFTHDGTTGHAGTCDICEQSYTSAPCTSFTYSVGSTAGYHTKKCNTCNHPYDTEEKCSEFEYVSDNGSHTKKCAQCKQDIETVECTIDYKYNGADGKHTHTGICSICQKPHTADCDNQYSQFKENDVYSHTLACTVCKNPVVTETCTTDYAEIKDSQYHRTYCSVCTITMIANDPCHVDWKASESNPTILESTCPDCGVKKTKEIPQENIKTITTASELAEVLSSFTDAGSGNAIVTIAENTAIDLTGQNWIPIKVDGYGGSGVITINGNGNTITGLSAPLFAGGFAGSSGIIINDLTIANSNIVSTHTTGSGAFIEYVDSMQTITLKNCHLLNSHLTGSRTGGLVGYTTGYSNTNNGAVNTYVTIQECSVVGCTIIGEGTVGGIIGHAGANPATYNTIKDCTVTNTKLTSNDDSYRVGVVVGTANVGEVTISGITESGNTLLQNNAGTEIVRPADQSNLYGRFVPSGTGKLMIDGTSITA